MYGSFTLAGCLLIVLLSLRHDDPDLAVRDIGIAGVLAVGTALLPYSIKASTFAHWWTFDAVFYTLDPPFVRSLCAYTWSHPAYYQVILTVYMAMAFALAAAYAVEHNELLLWSATLASLLAPVGFSLFPAVDPMVAFPGYPFRAPHPSLALMSNPAPDALVNCFPSMHLTWALLIFITARTWKVRVPAAFFVVGTVLATLGLGEHYLVDLVAAVPFSFAAVWAARRVPLILKPVEER